MAVPSKPRATGAKTTASARATSAPASDATQVSQPVARKAKSASGVSAALTKPSPQAGKRVAAKAPPESRGAAASLKPGKPVPAAPVAAGRRAPASKSAPAKSRVKAPAQSPARSPARSPAKALPKTRSPARPQAPSQVPSQARPSVAPESARAPQARAQQAMHELGAQLAGQSQKSLGEAVQAMGSSLGNTWQAIAGLSIPQPLMQDIQQDYIAQASALWNRALQEPNGIGLTDKRFAAAEWQKQPMNAFIASMYLLNAKTLQRMADGLSGDAKARQRVRFAVQQWTEAASPSNFLALNPEALAKAVSSKGESLSQGVRQLLHDIGQGHMSQTDESVFEVGVNVATTPGSVVYENPFFQLIEYRPVTAKVHAVPFVFVPPCINKYYILDLQPENSMVAYLLSQGHRVFMVSWVNADDSLAQASWDDYVEQGVIKALDVVREIVDVPQVNALGFCVGGTLLATALASLSARGQHPVRSLTLLTAFLDFVNTGAMDVFVDEAMVRMRELTIGPNSPSAGGLLRGGELATTFSFLRPNDLVWNYVVGNYLKGETPPPFDLLYWNSDSTNLPGPMYTWYLRNTYLENKLSQPGAVQVMGQPLDLRRLDMPTFVYGSREDHIVPWDSAYGSTQLVSGPCTFVLGASGHIAGVINPPQKQKRSHWVGAAGDLPASAQQWLAKAKEQPGSWWPLWSQWLGTHAGGWVAAPTAQGNSRHPVLEAAPGRYVKRKAG